MTDTTEQQTAIRCKANGCPLRWEVATYFHEPERKGQPRIPRGGVCRYHRAAPADQWTSTTRRIIEVYQYMRITRAVRAIGDTTYKPRASESVDQWLQRLDQLIDTHVLPDDGQPGAPVDIDELHRIIQGGQHG